MWCLQLVGFAWIVAAAYFAVRRRGSAWHRFREFVVTLFPEPWLLAAVPVLAVVFALVPHGVWRHLSFWNPVLALVGTACAVAGAGLMLWARWVLGTMWAGRPLVQQDHDLQTSGPYALVRHPIYTGIIGLALGAMLVIGSGQTLVVLAVTLAFVWWRVHVEDGLMTATFGARYTAYHRRVPALLPFRIAVPRGRAQSTAEQR